MYFSILLKSDGFAIYTAAFQRDPKHGFGPSNAKTLIAGMHPYACFDALITYTIKPNGTKCVAHAKQNKCFFDPNGRSPTPCFNKRS